MSNDTPASVEAQALMDRHFEIWNEVDPQARIARFGSIYASDFFVADHVAIAAGHAAVNELIGRVHREHAGFVFTPDPVTWNHGLGRATWGYGPAGQPGRVRGEDIFTIVDGKLASLHVFLDRT